MDREVRGEPEGRKGQCTAKSGDGGSVSSADSGTNPSTDIERLEEIGALENVEFSRSATPIVPVPKRDATFHLCGDSKVTLNAALEVG